MHCSSSSHLAPIFNFDLKAILSRSPVLGGYRLGSLTTSNLRRDLPRLKGDETVCPYPPFSGLCSRASLSLPPSLSSRIAGVYSIFEKESSPGDGKEGSKQTLKSASPSNIRLPPLPGIDFFSSQISGGVGAIALGEKLKKEEGAGRYYLLFATCAKVGLDFFPFSSHTDLEKKNKNRLCSKTCGDGRLGRNKNVTDISPNKLKAEITRSWD